MDNYSKISTQSTSLPRNAFASSIFPVGIPLVAYEHLSLTSTRYISGQAYEATEDNLHHKSSMLLVSSFPVVLLSTSNTKYQEMKSTVVKISQQLA
jgi:hypothetical protein